MHIIAALFVVFAATLPCVPCILFVDTAAAVELGIVPKVRAVLVEEAPIIDGELDDPVWEKAEVVTDLTQVEPRMGAPPELPD